MRKVLFIASVVLLLSGCSLTEIDIEKEKTTETKRDTTKKANPAKGLILIPENKTK